MFGKRQRWKRKAKPFMKRKGRKVASLDWRFKQKNSYAIKPEPFPRVLYTRAKYFTHGVLNVASSVATSHVYRLNSLWDPYFGVGGNTCTGHAELSALYGRYQVMGAKVTIIFRDTNGDGMRVGCKLRQHATGGTGALGWDPIGNKPNTYVGGLNNSGSQKKQFKLFVRPWSLQACSKLEYKANPLDYGAALNANPSEDTCLMDIFAIHPSGTSLTVEYDLRIIYYIRLYDRLSLSAD